MVVPAELLAFARELARRSDEPALRSAVSRAYYAAFLHCRASVIARGASVRGSGRDHQVVLEAVLRADHILGSQLRMLRNARNEADYDLHMTVTGLEARAACLRATRVMSFQVSSRQ